MGALQKSKLVEQLQLDIRDEVDSWPTHAPQLLCPIYHPAAGQCSQLSRQRFLKAAPARPFSTQLYVQTKRDLSRLDPGEQGFGGRAQIAASTRWKSGVTASSRQRLRQEEIGVSHECHH